MQEYKDIDMDSLVSDGPETINKNFKTLMSNNAGGEFPTENLYAGMICYRSDEGKIYTLKNDLTTWVELFDVSGANGAVTPKADALTKTLSVAEGGTGATDAETACANIGALPTAGGTMTGDIIGQKPEGATEGGYTLSASDAGFMLKATDDADAPATTGAMFRLQTKGRFDLVAQNDSGRSPLIGTPAGILQWRGRNIARTVDGVAADDDGNVDTGVRSIEAGGTGADNSADACANLGIDGAITGLSVSGKTITYTKKDGTTGAITTQDTVYSLPTASASVLGGIKVGSGLSISSGVLSASGGGTAYKIPYATCSTAGGTLAKVATVSNSVSYSLTTGTICVVKFTNKNTLKDYITLNVNSTGAKYFYNTSGAKQDNITWAANSHHLFLYNGTGYCRAIDNYNTLYSDYSDYSGDAG